MSDKGKKEKEVSPVWGETDTVRQFRAKVTTRNVAVLGYSITKGQVYPIAERKASRRLFEPVKTEAKAPRPAPQADNKPPKASAGDKHYNKAKGG